MYWVAFLFSDFLISESEYRYARWKKAVMKSMGWETSDASSNGNPEFIASQVALFSQLAKVAHIAFVDLSCSYHLWIIIVI